MGVGIGVHSVLVGKREGKRPLGKAWRNNNVNKIINMDLQELRFAKPSQDKMLILGGDLRETQVDVQLSVSHSCV